MSLLNEPGIREPVDPSAVYVASESFTCDLPTGVNGRIQNFTVIKGQTRIRGDHALLKHNSQYFQRVERGLNYDIEQATANPGERRAFPRG